MPLPEISEHGRRICILWDDGTWEERSYIMPNPEADLNRMRHMMEFRKAVDLIDWGEEKDAPARRLP